MPENYITAVAERGSINISDEVISVVVATALAEVDGVAGTGSTVGGEFAEFFGKKGGAKGVKVSFGEDVVCVDVMILVRFGCNIVSVAKKVQTEVCSAVESMTGIKAEVNVSVSGVAFDKN